MAAKERNSGAAEQVANIFSLRQYWLE